MLTLPKLVERVTEWNRERKTLPQIAAALPEAIDLLVVVMQAGLDFQVALSQYLERAPAGPLRDELAKLQTEIRTGNSRVDALRHLRDRVRDPGLQETVRSIIQGIELGSSLTPLLKAQAQALRQRRSYQAEKRAAVAPLKLMFPLFFFIFPTIFIVLFGPIYLTVMHGAVP